VSVLLGGGSVTARARLSFELDASLTIDGSSDSEISNKGLPTPHLMPALKDWKTQGAPTAGEGTMSTSGGTLEVSSSDDELDAQGLLSAPDATRSKSRIHDVSTHSRGVTLVGTQTGCSWICRWCVTACVLVYLVLWTEHCAHENSILFYKRNLIPR